MRKSDVLSTNLSLNQLELGVFTPRISVDWKYVDELAEDMETNGQQKPIICRPHPEKTETYQVIDGEYRVRAARKLGWSSIRAELRMLTEEEAEFLAIHVNEMHGKRLDPVEEAMHIDKIMRKYGYTETQVAKKMGKSQSWISQRLNLMRKAAPEVQKAIITRVIKPSTAREIINLPVEHQPKVLSKVVEDKLSSRKTARLVEAITENPDKAELVLSQPVKVLSEIVRKPEEFKRLVETAPEEPVMEPITCPHCGRQAWVDWIARKIQWTAIES